MKKIIADLQYTLVQFLRNRQALFFAFVFPLLFLVLAYYLFGSSAAATLYYVDNDRSQASSAFLESLNATGGLTLANGSGENLEQVLRDGRISAYLVIPQGFGQRAAGAGTGGEPASLELCYDRSSASVAPVVALVKQAVDQFNLGASGVKPPVSLSPVQVSLPGTGYLGFLLPGILGIAVMGSALDLTVGFISSYRATGLLRKLATTPISRVEWSLSRVLSGVSVALASVVTSMIVAWLAFGVPLVINPIALLLVITGAVLFVGLGMVLAYLVRDSDAASAASFTLTLPLILVSGSLFPVRQLPGFLQALAALSPLTYLNQGLRDALVTGNSGGAVTNLAIVAVAGFGLFCLGALALRWRDS